MENQDFLDRLPDRPRDIPPGLFPLDPPEGGGLDSTTASAESAVGDPLQAQRELMRRQQQTRMLCMYYYSNAVKLKLDSENEEVHSLDRIKEFPDMDPVWIDSLRLHAGDIQGKKIPSISGASSSAKSALSYEN